MFNFIVEDYIDKCIIRVKTVIGITIDLSRQIRLVNLC